MIAVKKTIMGVGIVAAGVAGVHHFAPALARRAMRHCRDMFTGSGSQLPCDASGTGCAGAAPGQA